MYDFFLKLKFNIILTKNTQYMIFLYTFYNLLVYDRYDDHRLRVNTYDKIII